MRAIELKLSDKLYQVVSVDTIRVHGIKGIKVDNVKCDKSGGGKNVVVVTTTQYSCDGYFAIPNSSSLNSKRYSSERFFTTLEAAQKHQLRRRKNEMINLLNKFKKARNEYEEFKAKYKNSPASNPE